jgi:hypothetical protein
LATVTGSASRAGAIITHATTGVLTGNTAEVTGASGHGSMTLTPADIAAIVAALQLAILPVNIVKVNSIDVDGTGADNDPWGPV